jgi:hypothetical protein
MSDDVLFIGWSTVVRGREAKALEIFRETAEYYASLQESGQIDSFEPLLLAPHGGGLAGFYLLRGVRRKLDEVRASEEFQALTIRAAAVVDNVGVIEAYAGEQIGKQMARFESLIDELVV